MKRMKKILTALLAITMMAMSLAVFPATTFAQTTRREETVGYQAVNADPSKANLQNVTDLSAAPTSGEYRVSTVDGLKKIAAFVEGGATLAGVTFYQTGNIVCKSSSNITPIGDGVTYFAGVYDGQGYQIRNLSLSLSTGSIGGLFGMLAENAVVRNLHLEDGSLSSRLSRGKGVGTVVGMMTDNATVENVYSSMKITSSTSDMLGGIVGAVLGRKGSSAQAVTVKNCTYEGKLDFSGRKQVGGIVGSASNSTLTVQDCLNLTALSDSKSQYYGGILGYAENMTSLSVIGCVNRGNLSGYQHLGGIVGSVACAIKIENCTNEATVLGNNGSYAGGIIGYAKGAATEIKGCLNKSTVTCTANADDAHIGGIVGYLEGGLVKACVSEKKIAARGHNLGGIVGTAAGETVRVEACINRGEYAANGEALGGIVGYLNAANGTVVDCLNEGKLSACSYAGGGIVGIVGKTATATVENCKNVGENCAGNMAAGIVAVSEGTLTIRKCQNIAKVWAGGKNVICAAFDEAKTVIEESVGAESAVQYIGYQAKEPYTEDGKTYQDFRLIGVVLSLDYKQNGFRVKVTDSKGNIIKNYEDYRVETVYRELIAENVTICADSYAHGGYFYILDMPKIPVSHDTLNILVEPFAVKMNGEEEVGVKSLYFLPTGDSALGKIPDYDVILSDPTVIFQGAQGDTQWGHYQFPTLSYATNGSIIARWSYGNDDVYGGGGNDAIKKVLVSDDGGVTWRDATDADKTKYTLPIGGFSNVSGYDEAKLSDRKTYPPAVEGGGFRLYFAEDLRGVSTKLNTPFRASLFNETTQTYVSQEVTVNWPHMPVYAWGSANTIAPVNYLMAINGKFGFIEKDGALYYCTYTRGFDSSAKTREEAIANPYCYFYSVYVFKSVDQGKTWDYISQVSVDADVYNSEGFNKSCEGFCEPMMTVMADGSVVMLMRTGGGSPCYIVRSTNDCASWSKPVLFDHVGVLPQLLTLDCGVTIASYGRPGLYFRTSSDPIGQVWKEHIQIELSPKAVLADLSCYYTNLLPLDDHSALLIYSDFNHPDLSDGEGYCKSILVRKITIQFKH